MIQGKNEQGTYEWKEERHGMIGGTALKDLMVDKSVEDLPMFYKLLGDKSEIFFDEFSFINDAMQRGLDLEPVAIAEAEELLGVNFKSFGWCTSKLLPLNGCSPDGFTADLVEGIEVKCPNASTHMEYIIKNEIPKVYFWQCINYFLVNTDLETLHFVSFRPECKVKPLFVKTINRGDFLSFKIGRKSQDLTVNQWACLAEKKSNEMLELVQKELKKLEF